MPSLAVVAGTTWQASSPSGFGSSAKRSAPVSGKATKTFFDVDVDETPGPGAYNHSLRTSSPSVKATMAFSGPPRFKDPQSNGNAGPGSYDIAGPTSDQRRAGIKIGTKLRDRPPEVHDVPHYHPSCDCNGTSYTIGHVGKGGRSGARQVCKLSDEVPTGGKPPTGGRSMLGFTLPDPQ